MVAATHRAHGQRIGRLAVANKVGPIESAEPDPSKNPTANPSPSPLPPDSPHWNNDRNGNFVRHNYPKWKASVQFGSYFTRRAA